MCEENNAEGRKESGPLLKDNSRWAKAIFACLDKIEELTKAPDFTKESAEITRILADTARKLETTE